MGERRYKRAYATLALYSRTLSEDELRELVPIEPNDAIQKGTPHGRKGHVHPHTMLGFRSRVDEQEPPEAHLADLLDLVRPAKTEIRRFADEARTADPDARMYVYIRLIVESGRDFGFDLDASSLQDILDLGAGFGIEIDVEDDDDSDA